MGKPELVTYYCPVHTDHQASYRPKDVSRIGRCGWITEGICPEHERVPLNEMRAKSSGEDDDPLRFVHAVAGCFRDVKIITCEERMQLLEDP